MSSEFYTVIYPERIKNEITPFDYEIHLVTYQKSINPNVNSKLFNVTLFRITKRDIPQLIKELQRLL